ncbi:MAG: RNA polymerase sigma factor [Bacteroidetes bacterium]|nr:RNA polymerase sigma factor [Bacteroidota bacterium]MBU1680719.1 RNA polymerase sigma factor [Bacteroidota bacterium]
MLETTKYNFLIEQYKNNIFSYSIYMTRNRMDADDITQEVLIRIWKNLDKFNILAAKSWIMKTTHNLCIDYLRRRSKQNIKEFSLDEDFIESIEDSRSETNPYLATHIKIMHDKVKETIKELPENLRAVFVLYEIQGLKYKEVAEAIDIPINSVKVYLLRARKKLQEELKHYEPQEVI